MTARTEPNKKFKKSVTLGSNIPEREIELSLDVLQEALDPGLTVEELWIPGFNATIDYLSKKNAIKVTPIRGARRLYIHFLTPHYEKKLYNMARPLFDEANKLIQEFNEKGGVKSIDWGADLGYIVQGLVERMVSALGDYDRVISVAASVVAEASIVCARKYKAEPLTDEDHKAIEMLNPDYFMESVPSDYVLKQIIIPQFKKTGIADLVGIFFSKLKAGVLLGLGSLIQDATGSIISNTSTSPTNSEASAPSSTITLEPNLSSLGMEAD